jgi:hypothetical protein
MSQVAAPDQITSLGESAEDILLMCVIAIRVANGDQSPAVP